MNCKKASEAIERREVQALSFAEKLSLKWHLLNCSICRAHARFSLTIGAAIRSSQLDAKVQALENTLKKRIQNIIDETTKD